MENKKHETIAMLNIHGTNEHGGVSIVVVDEKVNFIKGKMFYQKDYKDLEATLDKAKEYGDRFDKGVYNIEDILYYYENDEENFEAVMTSIHEKYHEYKQIKLEKIKLEEINRSYQ